MVVKETLSSVSYTEEIVKRDVSMWTTDFGIDVWWEKKNAYGYGVFSVPTGRKKPDLLIRWKDNIVLIEVKNAESCSNVYNSFFQLLGYYNNISTVTVDNKQFNVTGFVVATQYSIQGHLFPDEQITTYESFTDGRKRAVREGCLPPAEYTLSEMFTRLLWRTKQKKDVFIGALLSSALSFPSGDPVPTILAKKNGKQFFEEVRS